MTTLSPYVKIHETEITAYLRDGYPRPVEPSRKIKDASIIGTNKAVLWSEGRKTLGYRATCSFLPSQYATYDTVAAAFDFEDEERLFYPLDAGRFAVCKFGCSDPLEPKFAAEGPMKRLHGGVWSEAAELYDATAITKTLSGERLDLDDIIDFNNDGNIDAALYSASLTASYSEGHIENLALSIRQTGSVWTTLETEASDPIETEAGEDIKIIPMAGTLGETDTLSLVPLLMSGEVFALDRFGQITQTYEDDFASSTDFGYDGYCYSKYIGSEIVLTAPDDSEAYSITITDTDQASTTVSVSGNAITVDLETDAGTPVATAQEVIDAINADADVITLEVVATLADGEDGTTVMAALSQTYFALNVAVTGGALVIQDDREAEYHLVGTHPIAVGGLRVTFTPTMTGSGAAAFEVSVDSGANWRTVIDSDSGTWTDGEEMVVYIPQAEGKITVWIRWACDSDITSVAIDDLTISQQRSVPTSSVPVVGANEVGVVSLTGDDSSGTLTGTLTFRSRYKP